MGDLPRASALLHASQRDPRRAQRPARRTPHRPHRTDRRQPAHRPRSDGIYPTHEEFYTIAPAQAQDKELNSFAGAWADHTDEALARLERRADTAIALASPSTAPGQPRRNTP